MRRSNASGHVLWEPSGGASAATARLRFRATRDIAAGEPLSVNGHALSGDDLLVKKAFKGDATAFEAAASDDGALMVVVDTQRDENKALMKKNEEVTSAACAVQ